MMCRNQNVCYVNQSLNVRLSITNFRVIEAADDEDDMGEIDASNILGGRTRGKAIDYNKVDPSEFPEDDEDEDDDDFEDPDANNDAMQE